LAAPNSGVEVVQQAIAPLAREIAYVGMSGELGGPIFGVTWQVLAPSKSPESVDDSNGSLINNNSVVLLVSTLHHRVLLTGDIEIDAQNNLMNSISNPAVDIVKVPHHGSVYQSPDFASWVDAKFAWISVSADNDYGHPNPTTISLYQSAGSQVLSTKDCGHIVIGQTSYSTSRSCV
jgi:competence protein ComEC